MKKYIKKVTMLCVIALLLSVMAACGSKNSSTESSSAATSSMEPSSTASESASGTTAEPAKNLAGQEIKVWIQRYGQDPSIVTKLMEELAAKFKEETGIIAKPEIIDWGQALTKYQLAVTGGDAPDVADLFWIQSFQKLGGDKMGPLKVNDLAQEIGVDKFYEGSLYDVKVGDDFYGLPWRFDTRVLAYNDNYFKEAGITEPPKTWDELIEDAKKLTKTDAKGNITRAGLLFFNNESRFDQDYFSAVVQAGGKLFTDDLSAPAFDSPEAKEAAQFMQDAIYKHKVTPKNIIDPSFNSVNEFLAGKAAMVFGMPADMKTVQEAQAPQLNGVMKAAVMPSKTGEGPSSVAFAAPISILASSKHIDAAKEWVKFFLREDNQLEVSKRLALLNSNKKVMADSYFTSNEWLKAFVDQAARTVYGDAPLSMWNQIDAFPDGPLPTYTTKLMFGKPIDEILPEAIEKTKKIMADNK